MAAPSAAQRLATYADIEALPPHVVGEIVGGRLQVSPRPASLHTRAASRLGFALGGPFDVGSGGPGGWLILDGMRFSGRRAARRRSR